ncbi:MAG: Rne/Rng family ribonuclease, partial [Myxococcota bacterium]
MLAEYYLEREQERGLTGNIHKGRVDRVLPGMQAAFLDLGPSVERKAYLYVGEIPGAGDEASLLAGYDSGDGKSRRRRKPSRAAASQRNIEDLIKKGQLLPVQIVKEPIDSKGARVSGYLSLPGRHCVLMPGVDKVGVSHRISSETERKRLREIVDAARPKNIGFIVRTAAEGAPEDEVRDDVDYLLKLWEQTAAADKKAKKAGVLYGELDLVLRSIRDLLRDDIAEILIDDEEHYNRACRFAKAFMPRYLERIKLYEGRRPIFDHFGIEQELRRALSRKVPLKSGGSLVIDQGEALTAIDVNTGSFVGSKDLEDTITKNNLEACKEVARQLRLRNIGGIIVVDFVDMDKADNRQLVWEEFNKALSKDRSRANVTRISELGLVEMTRKRNRESLSQLLSEPCPTCNGRAVIKSASTVAHEALREVRRVGASVKSDTITIEARPAVADFLRKHERTYIDALEKRFQKLVEIKGTSKLDPEEYKVAGRSSREDLPDAGRHGKGSGRKRGGRGRGT